jgi:cobalt/nickel transport system permease protein
MIEEVFAVGTSRIHRVDPRHRVVFAAVFSVQTAIGKEPAALILALAAALVLVLAARLDARRVLQRSVPVLAFLMLLWLVLPWTVPGRPWLTTGPLSASMEGVRLSWQISLKSISILLALMALTATMTAATLGHALHHLGVPEKIVSLLMITYRYLFVIEAEFTRLWRAAKVRGFRPQTNLHSYRTYAYLVGMLFVRASDRAERVYAAMRCRGFKGKFYTLAVFPAGRDTVWFSLGMSGLAIAMAAAEWTATV